jgi:alkylation response protein AidB-like acyl-CoA dehydrogenase
LIFVSVFRCGDLGLLGVTVDVEHGGSGMDATAAVIVHEELSAADPAFTLRFVVVVVCQLWLATAATRAALPLRALHLSTAVEHLIQTVF